MDGQFQLVHSDGRVVWNSNRDCGRQTRFPAPPKGGVSNLTDFVVDEFVLWDVRVETVCGHPRVDYDIKGGGTGEFGSCARMFREAGERRDALGFGNGFGLNVLDVKGS